MRRALLAVLCFAAWTGSAAASPSVALFGVEARGVVGNPRPGKPAQVELDALCPAGSVPISAGWDSAADSPLGVVPVHKGDRWGWHAQFGISFGKGGPVKLLAICARGAGGLRVAVGAPPAHGIGITFVTQKRNTVQDDENFISNVICPGTSVPIGYGWWQHGGQDTRDLIYVTRFPPPDERKVQFSFESYDIGHEPFPIETDLVCLRAAGLGHAGVGFKTFQIELEPDRGDFGPATRTVSCPAGAKPFGVPWYSIGVARKPNDPLDAPLVPMPEQMLPLPHGTGSHVRINNVWRNGRAGRLPSHAVLSQPCIATSGWTVDISALR